MFKPNFISLLIGFLIVFNTIFMENMFAFKCQAGLFLQTISIANWAHSIMVNPERRPRIPLYAFRMKARRMSLAVHIFRKSVADMFARGKNIQAGFILQFATLPFPAIHRSVRPTHQVQWLALAVESAVVWHHFAALAGEGSASSAEDFFCLVCDENAWIFYFIGEGKWVSANAGNVVVLLLNYGLIYEMGEDFFKEF